MTLMVFLLQDSFRKIEYFEKIFMLVYTSMKLILRILFLSFNNVDIKFADQRRLK